MTDAPNPIHNGPRGSSLVRGLEILDRVGDKGRVRVDELAALVDLPLSTVYRYVRQLRASGYLHEVDGSYCLGRRFSSSAERKEAGHLVRVAEPILNRLRETTGEAAILAVRVQSTALCLDRVMPQRRYVLSFQRGTIRPLYAGASATILLAFAPEEIIEEVLHGPIRRATANTPEREDLPKLLAVIREQGFALSHGEVDPGMVGIAAPAFRGEQCICAVSVAGPASRLNGPKIDAAIAAVLTAGRELGQGLESVYGATAWTTGDY